MSKYQNEKGVRAPRWVRYSAVTILAALAVIAFLVVSGIAGQHWLHILHNTDMSGKVAPPVVTP